MEVHNLMEEIVTKHVNKLYDQMMETKHQKQIRQSQQHQTVTRHQRHRKMMIKKMMIINQTNLTIVKTKLILQEQDKVIIEEDLIKQLLLQNLHAGTDIPCFAVPQPTGLNDFFDLTYLCTGKSLYCRELCV